jgi:hypothetical protein
MYVMHGPVLCDDCRPKVKDKNYPTLQHTNARLVEDNVQLRIDIAALEAELVTLKARRCETCRKFTYMDCPVWPAIHRAGTDAPSAGLAFFCSEWAAREPTAEEIAERCPDNVSDCDRCRAELMAEREG